MNRVTLVGRVTADPELRNLASSRAIAQFSVATNEYLGQGREKAEFHSIVAWDRLAEVAAGYLAKGSLVAVEGRLHTRTWDDDAGRRHWKTEVVAVRLELLSGRRKKDFDAESAAEGLAAEPDEEVAVVA